MPYPLTTDRLTIAPLGPTDVGAFAAYRSEPEVARWQSWDVPFSDADARRLVDSQPTTALPAAGDWLQLGIHDAGGALLGDVAVHTLDGQPDSYELGVTLAPASQGEGIASEALGRVIGELFQVHGAHRVVAFCDVRNAPVQRLLARVGMRHESHQVDADWFKGEWTSLDGYALLRSERQGAR